MLPMSERGRINQSASFTMRENKNFVEFNIQCRHGKMGNANEGHNDNVEIRSNPKQQVQNLEINSKMHNLGNIEAKEQDCI